MKITKRQLRRIIRESLQTEHPYDTAKEETAHYGTESDAIVEILNDLTRVSAPPEIVIKVEEAEHYEEDLYYVLSLIPAEIKDKMI